MLFSEEMLCGSHKFGPPTILAVNKKNSGLAIIFFFLSFLHKFDHASFYYVQVILNRKTCIKCTCIVESRFYEPPRETKIGSKNQRVREIEA